MKQFFKNKKVLGATSLVLVTSLVIGNVAFRKSGKKDGSSSMLGIPQVQAADDIKDYDSSSAVNYSTILRRAIDYGILSKTLTQIDHMETTFAVDLYRSTKGTNNDVDLAGDAPAQFIIARVEPGSKVRFGATFHEDGDPHKPSLPMDFVIDTTEALANSDTFVYDTAFVGEHLYRTYPVGDLQTNIQSMLDHVKSESDKMLQKGAFNGDDLLSNSNVLDFDSDEYENATIYIDVPENGRLYAAIQDTDKLQIKKRSSTVIVFNVLQKNSITLDKYYVTVDGKDIHTDTTCEGNSPAGGHNDDVNKEIAQKII